MVDAPYTVQLLGGLGVVQADGSAVKIPGRKDAALLAYLVYYRQRPHPREELVDLFYSDNHPPRAGLSAALKRLRDLFESLGASRNAVFLGDRDTVQCNPEVCATDVAAFELALRSAARAPDVDHRLRLQIEAAKRYRGDLLPGFYEDWVLAERVRLQTVYLDTLAQITAALENTGDLGGAIVHARRMVDADPLHEEAHETLIRLYAAAGQIDDARRQFRALARRLEKQGDAPDPALQKRLREWSRRPPQPDKREMPGMRRESPRADTEISQRLPRRATRFFGRETETATLCAWLGAADTRIITLTGSAGNGKTRLAIEVAERLFHARGGNVWFVQLSDIADPGRIAAVVRDRMDLPRAPGAEPLDQIARTLAKQPALLVLDTFEHLLRPGETAGAASVLALLQRAAGLTCLITSRQRLEIPGEREFEVPPLPTPPIDGSPETLPEYAGFRLFTDRAQAAKPDFQMTPRKARDVALLCSRLEGIPLALELAAARAPIMTPAQMVRQLEAPFGFLAERARDAASRHQTLFGAIDWSFRLLAPPQRDFFARLSVFRGGWTLEAADAIAGAGAVEHLSQLHGCSLVLASEQNDEMRFRMLDMIRSFAALQLGPAEREALRARHAEHYLHWAEAREEDVSGRAQAGALDEMEAEHDNLRAALHWSLEHDEADLGLRLCAALGFFWQARGHIREGREWIEKMLASPGAGARTRARAYALHVAGILASLAGGHGEGVARWEESLSLFRELGDAGGTIRLLNRLGSVYCLNNAPERARALYDEARGLAERSGNPRSLADCFFSFALLAEQQGDGPAARAAMEQSLALQRGIGDRGATASALYHLAFLAREEERSALFEEALALFRELRVPWRIAGTLTDLALFKQAQGDHAAMLPLLDEALPLLRRLGATDGTIQALDLAAQARLRFEEVDAAQSLVEEGLQLARETQSQRRNGLLNTRAAVRLRRGDVPGAAADALAGLFGAWEARGTYENYPMIFVPTIAGIAVERNLPADALRLLGALHTYREAVEPTLWWLAPLLQGDGLLARIRPSLPPADFAAAWEQGRALSEEQAVQSALQLLRALTR